jgi:hypothetical protein
VEWISPASYDLSGMTPKNAPSLGQLFAVEIQAIAFGKAWKRSCSEAS